jgi:uncharacterized ferredoxin-like protein
MTKTFHSLSEVKETYFPKRDVEFIRKSMMTCPLCGNHSIEIVNHCATCKICGWKGYNA